MGRGSKKERAFQLAARGLLLKAMADYLKVLALALLPAVGNFLGGLLAEWLDTPRKALNWALHGAAGIVVAVVAIELMPEALKGAPAWLVVLSFLLGGGLFIAIRTAVDAWQERKGGEESAGPWIIYIAVSVDLFSDGLMIGASSVVSFSLALVLALGQMTADVPEGFATIATFKDRKVPRRKRLLLAASFCIPILLGATLGYWVLRDQSEAVKVSALALVAGLLLVAAVEDMVSEAHEAVEDTRLSIASFVGGFGLFTLVASYLG